MAQLALNGTIQIPLSVNYVTRSSSGSPSASYTFSSTSILQPGLIVIGVHSFANSTAPSLTSVTVNGVTASLVQNVKATRADPSSSIAALAYIRVNTGNTADIVVNFSGSGANMCVISVWNIQGNLSDSPISSANDVSTTTLKSSFVITLNGDNTPTAAVSIISNALGDPSYFPLPTTYIENISTRRFSGTFYKKLSTSSTTIVASTTGSAPTVLIGAVWR
jgi:hypothetical protein